MSKALSPGSIGLALPSVFLITYAVLTFEVALTRIFSVMLSYHFVFAIVSAALLGLGGGAMLLKRWRGLRISSAFRVGGILFPLLIVVSVLLIITLPQITAKGFWIYLVLAVLPFAASAAALGALLLGFSSARVPA